MLIDLIILTLNWSLFIGRFHPILVHLPIGILMVSYLLELFARVTNQQRVYGRAVTFCLGIGMLSAMASAFVGFLLASEGGYDENNLFWHQWLGVLLATLTLLLFLIKFQIRQGLPVEKVYFPMFSFGVMLLFFVGHLGGNLTHGSDYLIVHAPDIVKQMAGEEIETKESRIFADIHEMEVYGDLVQPILEKKCMSCHNASKMKGELRLDQPTHILKGGEHGPAVVAGQVKNSLLYKRVTLPETDKKVMPPKGKEGFTAKELTLIKWWIEKGSPFEGQVEESEKKEEVASMLEYFRKKNNEEVNSKMFVQADPAVVLSLNKVGLLVLPLGAEDNQLEVRLINKPDTFSVNKFKAIEELAPQLVLLDLSNQEMIDDSYLEVIGRLPGIKKLFLQNSNVSSRELTHLENLKKLEVLNLYGTQIDDKAIATLKKLPQLEKLYVWNTAMTGEGIEELRNELPKVEVVF